MEASDRDHGFSAVRTGDRWVVTVPGLGETRPIGPRMVDPAARREWMARVGVSAQILAPWMDIQFGVVPAGRARDWARRLNDAMLEAAAELGSGSRALATVALHDADRAAEDLVHAVRGLEMAGLLLSTNPVDGTVLHDPRLDPLWAAAVDNAVPIVLHPPTLGPSGAIPGFDGFGNVYGRLVDSTAAVARLILSGLLDRHPGLRLVLVHGGGFLAYQAARLDGGYRAGEIRDAPLHRELPSNYLRDFRYDTVTLSPPAVRFLVDAVGADRVLLGSDYPFPIGDPAPVQTILAADLPAEDADAVLCANAHGTFPGVT